MSKEEENRPKEPAYIGGVSGTVLISLFSLLGLTKPGRIRDAFIFI
jgi:hypothetical protein